MITEDFALRRNLAPKEELAIFLEKVGMRRNEYHDMYCCFGIEKCSDVGIRGGLRSENTSKKKKKGEEDCREANHMTFKLMKQTEQGTRIPTRECRNSRIIGGWPR